MAVYSVVVVKLTIFYLEREARMCLALPYAFAHVTENSTYKLTKFRVRNNIFLKIIFVML